MPSIAAAADDLKKKNSFQNSQKEGGIVDLTIDSDDDEVKRKRVSQI